MRWFVLVLLGGCEAPVGPVVPERVLPSTASTSPLTSVPIIDAPVTDLAGLLAPEELQALDARVRAVRDETGVQMAVLTVPALPVGMPIEDFSLQVADQWGGGSARDDGLLVTMAWRDRRSRIEVGYGLEGYVTDAEAGQLLQDAAPYLRANDTAGALGLVVDGLHGQVASLRPGEGPSVWRRAYGAGLRWAPPRPLTSLLGFFGGALLAPWLAWTRRSGGFPSRWRRPARRNRRALRLGGLCFFAVGSLILWFFGAPMSVAGFLGSALVAGVVQLPVGFATSPRDLRWGLWTAGIMGVLGLVAYVGIWWSGDSVAPEFAWLFYGTLGSAMTLGASLPGSGGGGGGGGSYSSSGSSSSSSGGGSSGSGSGGWSGGGGGFGGGGASGSW